MTHSANETSAATANAGRLWPLFRSFAGWRPADLSSDAIAGLTLAVIAIPEQMATARLAGFAPQIGFVALFAGAIGFAVFGDSRRVSVGADSTIAPIFAGALAALAAAGPAHYAQAAATLGLSVGVVLMLGGALRFGFIADLLSIPVTTGFLVGIAGHILVSQALSTRKRLAFVSAKKGGAWPNCGAARNLRTRSGPSMGEIRLPIFRETDLVADRAPRSTLRLPTLRSEACLGLRPRFANWRTLPIAPRRNRRPLALVQMASANGQSLANCANLRSLRLHVASAERG